VILKFEGFNQNNFAFTEYHGPSENIDQIKEKMLYEKYPFIIHSLITKTPLSLSFPTYPFDHQITLFVLGTVMFSAKQNF
jgi:hypothetical protein